MPSSGRANLRILIRARRCRRDEHLRASCDFDRRSPQPGGQRDIPS